MEVLVLFPWSLSGRPLGAVNAKGTMVFPVLSDTYAMGLPSPAAASLRSAGGAGAMLMMSTWSRPSLKPVPWTQGQEPLGARSALGIVMPARHVTLTSVRCGWCWPPGEQAPTLAALTPGESSVRGWEDDDNTQAAWDPAFWESVGCEGPLVIYSAERQYPSIG